MMAGVIKQAGWDPKEIDMINGHATATKIGDPVEALAIKTVLATSRENLCKENFATPE